MSIIWDDNEDNVVNKKIREIWDYMSTDQLQAYEVVRDKCRELFEMGFTDGQQYVWAVRAGRFVNNKGEPVDIDGNPRDENEQQCCTLTTNSNGDVHSFSVVNGKLEEIT